MVLQNIPRHIFDMATLLGTKHGQTRLKRCLMPLISQKHLKYTMSDVKCYGKCHKSSLHHTLSVLFVSMLCHREGLIWHVVHYYCEYGPLGPFSTRSIYNLTPVLNQSLTIPLYMIANLNQQGSQYKLSPQR